MRSNGEGFLKKTLMAFAIFLMLPTFAVATQAQQGWGWGQNDDRRRERRERRQQRREVRRERRDDRRDDRGVYRNDGYYGNDNGYYGNNNARQTALNAGYNNGIEEGRKDRQRGERFEYRDESDYQKATEDYSSRLGDRNLYQQYFRQGFANGYRTGYNGY
ncbi:MAG TPA: hypothetical protein VF240_00270 [Pyrinomonadaceae bacterium]